MNSWFEHNLRILNENSRYSGIVEQLNRIVEEPILNIYSKEEAQTGADKGIMECLEQYAHETVRSIVITGFEYGFLVERVLESMPMQKTAVLILESDVNQLRKAMQVRDLSHIFSNGHVFIYVESKESFEKKLTFFITNNFYFITHRILFLENPALRIWSGEYVDFLRQSFAGARKSFQINLGNSPEDTLLGNLHNTFNLKQMIGSYPFENICNKFTKVPAICVAAGPSLEKNLHLLKDMQDHVLIFACDTIMEKLQRHGIEPHFMASLERNQEVYQYFFKNKNYSNKTILLGLSLLYPTIYEEYAGAKVIVARRGLTFEKWVSESIPTLAHVHAGSSVAHLNYTIAKELGCDPIVLIGQDLAYGDNGLTHAKETYDEIDDFAATNGIVDFGKVTKVKIKGFYGGTVETQPIWDTFRKWFEDRIREAPGTLINATEGGAYIEGALHMSLSEVIDKYCQDKIDFVPLEEIRNYRLDEKEYSIIGRNVYLAYKTQYDHNLEITKELEKLLLNISRIPKKSEWNKNKLRLVSKFQQYYQQFLNITMREQTILNTIQFVLINIVSKINRMADIETFEQVEIICSELERIVTMTIHYMGKSAEIYNIGMKVLVEFSETNQRV